MSNFSSGNSSKWVKPLAQTGLAAKGVVYCLMGILTIMAIFHLDNKNTGDADKGGIFKMVHEQPMGKVLLGIIGLGLLCYALWRIIMAVKDTERKGTDAKGIGQRIVYFFSGLVYISVAFVAAKLVFQNKQSNGNSREQLASELLDKPLGIWLAGIVALGMIGVGIMQIYRAISGKYRKYVEESIYDNKVKSILIKSGQVGYIARGIVWLIIGWLFMQAAIHHNANKAGNTSEAFKWLQDSVYGDILLVSVALGLICYGVFMFLRARYQPIRTR